ncbi:MAG: lactate utilization protein B [Pseudomonadota bacterium]
MEQTSERFLEQATEALGDIPRREAWDVLGQLMPLAYGQAADRFGDFEALREHMSRVRKHSLDNLDHYLPRFEEEAIANGNQVHYARDSAELNETVLAICREHDARLVAKGKSMVTEETALNEHLLRAGLRVVETDLGEYIIQEAGETPSHIVGPALHKPVDEIRELFLARHDFGERELAEPADMVAEARTVLRETFLKADVGIIGANALIAENGYSLLVTNEGNGDLCANLPPVLIVCTTIERLLPRTEDALSLVRLLARAAIGQPISCYTSLYSGPRREDELDGPLETHIVLLDNRRSDILTSDYRDMLQCIRCGACLNHCPVYVGAGGHAYGWVYPGPMGSILTPLLTSLEDSHVLPNACTSCGRCEEVCPANIPLVDLLRDLRREEQQRKLSPRRWRLGLRLHSWLAGKPRLYQTLTRWGVKMLSALGRKRGSFRRLPFAQGWTDARDFPAPQGSTFMAQYERQQQVSVDEQ